MSFIALVLTGFIVGVLWFGALRFFLRSPHETHYHANFAVYVDNVREEFKSFTYYEEVAACSDAYADNPKGRVHMHDQINDVIHVHDKRVAYADFFNNINWTLGPDFVRTDDGLITATDTKKWHFLLNGEAVDRVDNLIIGNEDTLLISYGAADLDYSAQYNAIAHTAAETNHKQDPSTCSGLNGPHDTSFSARLKRAFDFTE